jgi:hypothetical protein
MSSNILRGPVRSTERRSRIKITRGTKGQQSSQTAATSRRWGARSPVNLTSVECQHSGKGIGAGWRGRVSGLGNLSSQPKGWKKLREKKSGAGEASPGRRQLNTTTPNPTPSPPVRERREFGPLPGTAGIGHPSSPYLTADSRNIAQHAKHGPSAHRIRMEAWADGSGSGARVGVVAPARRPRGR